MRLSALVRVLSGRRRPRTVAFRRGRPPCTRPVAELEDRLLPSVAIVVDYSFDSGNFFNTQARRDEMQAAANAVGGLINDNLLAIAPSGSDTWSALFPNPSTGQMQAVANLVVPANTLIVYVGGEAMAASGEAGEGTAGGYSASGDQAWLDTVAARGQAGALAATPTDYGPWGGSIAFSTTTNFSFSADPGGIGPDQVDFFSTALHELGHVLGLGTSPSWKASTREGRSSGPPPRPRTAAPPCRSTRRASTGPTGPCRPASRR